MLRYKFREGERNYNNRHVRKYPSTTITNLDFWNVKIHTRVGIAVKNNSDTDEKIFTLPYLSDYKLKPSLVPGFNAALEEQTNVV